MPAASFLSLGLSSPRASRPGSLGSVALLRCHATAPAEPAADGDGRGSTLEAYEVLLRAERTTPAVAERLADLIGTEHLVGFNLVRVERDVGLTAPLGASWVDLDELAALLLPPRGEHSLADLRGRLELLSVRDAAPEQQAATAAEVYLGLLERIEQLDLDTLTHVSRLAAPLDWPYKSIFAQAQRERMRRFLAAPPGSEAQGRFPGALQRGTQAAERRKSLTPTAQRRELDVERVKAAFTATGELGRALAGFEQRPEQQTLARQVAETINRGGTLIAEAGTGTGKSLAYLLPSVLFAAENSRRVVVSTNTINLQDQLFEKDLPDVARVLGVTFRSAVLKGRTNYLCLRRWGTRLRADDLEPHERTLLIKTLLWLTRTQTGDKAELRLEGLEEEAWAAICAQADACNPLRCEFHRSGQCFVARARRWAEESHVVVVNHSLLLADAASGSGVVPDYEHLVIDEAHHLEREATAQLGWRISQRELLARLGLLAEHGGVAGAGLVGQLLGLLRRASPKAGREEQALLSGLEVDLSLAVERTQESIARLFASLRAVTEERGQQADGQRILRIAPAVRAQPAWGDVELGWDELAARARGLLHALSRLQERVEEQVSGEVEEWTELAGELVAQMVFWDSTHRNLAAVLEKHQPELVGWLTGARNDDLWINSAPLHVGPVLREKLFDAREAVVLTSATLSTDGNFRYVKERMSLEDAAELILGSPFDFRQNALLFLPRDIPEPMQSGYQEQLQAAICSAAKGLGGRTLVLFTSYAQLRATYLAVRQALAEQDITLLAQGMNGESRAALLEAFRADQRTVLFGTNSFWEGVDVVGDALSCVMLARLPFSVPSDPIFEARSEQFEDPFRQFAVPQAILRFKQGFGRLIRSQRDRGAVVVLDRRLESKFYGRAFLRSLPSCTVTRGSVAGLGAALAEWIATVPRPVGRVS